jgi:lysine-N-methylase
VDPTFPARPKLAAHVVARRHLVSTGEGGDAVTLVVLHDLSTGALVQVGAREWGLLAAADGTRDLDGIVLAAAREGAHVRGPALAAFFEQLHAAGMLDDGVIPEREPAPAADDDGAADRPTEPLPGFALWCDGAGSCCRIYASVVFAPVEAARARALAPRVLGGGDRHERVFMPEHGSGPTGGAVVTSCDGRCAYLAETGRCALHEAGGAAAKPLGCATFPATFVDDGQRVRVSVAVECACVLASAERPDRDTPGAALLPEGVRARRHLDPAIAVVELPSHLGIAPGVVASRAEVVAWSRRALTALDELATGVDVAAALIALAAAIDGAGLDAPVAPALAEPPGIAPSLVAPYLAALHRHAEARARKDASWRAPRDLARLAVRWIADATAPLVDAGAVARLLARSPVSQRSELFYARALVHGHQLFGALELTTALRDRAARLLAARALHDHLATLGADEKDPASEHPLALVEAVLRGHGLAAYAEDVPV